MKSYDEELLGTGSVFKENKRPCGSCGKSTVNYRKCRTCLAREESFLYDDYADMIEDMDRYTLVLDLKVSFK